MTQSEFSHILASINALSPQQMRHLQRELESRMVAQAKPAGRATKHRSRDAAEETAFDVASRAGLIGCIKGESNSPTDLSTNPKHMKGFGRE
jgi:hypothetical protein